VRSSSLRFAVAVCIASAASAAPSPQEIRDQGDNLYAVGQYQEALHKYQVAWVLERVPLDLLKIGRCRFKLGEIRAAKDVLFRFLQLDPTSEYAPEAFDIITELEKAEAKVRPAPEVVVDFDSEPPGASVEIEDGIVCPATPCTRSVLQGQYLVAMQKDGYEPASGAFYAKAGARLSLKLARLEGQISLISEPSGLPVMLDGKPAGRTPLLIEKVAAARHEVAIEDTCYQRAAESFDVRKDDRRSVVFVMRPRETDLTLNATDDSGRPIAATALLGGQRLGEVPGTHRVSACAKSLRVESGRVSVERPLRLTGEIAVLNVQLPVGRCERVVRQNRIAGLTAAAGGLLAAGGMTGALVLQHAVLDAPAGDAGVRSKASLGKTLNVIGLVGIAAAAVGLTALGYTPSSASACAGSAP